jgi:hypothetical protein
VDCSGDGLNEVPLAMGTSCLAASFIFVFSKSQFLVGADGGELVLPSCSGPEATGCQRPQVSQHPAAVINLRV